MLWLGVDLGGANIKLADGQAFAESRTFALWRQPKRLANELRTAIAHAPPADHLAVAMTAELADCFASKVEGVRFLLQAVSEAADGRHTRIYLRNGMLVSPQVALQRPLDAAAANWHALARFATRYAADEHALLFDIGSTTCDLVPLVKGQIAATGTTDTERLLAGELLYTGVERSPVCALVDSVPYRGQLCPVAQEMFATTRDVYTILQDLPETAAADFSADGRPHLKVWARMRLARMVCADTETFHHRDAVEMAQAIATAQVDRVARAIRQVASAMPQAPTACILSGHGEFVARRALEAAQLSPRLVSLENELGARISRSATAHALAVLATEAAGP